MVFSRRTCAPAFAPSPPLSATAGTSDSEFDGHDKIPPRRQRPRIDSSPASLSSRGPSRASERCLLSAAAVSSSSSSATAPDQEEQEDRGGDLARAFSVIKASWEDRLPDLPSPDWHVLHISPPQYLELCRLLADEDPDLLDYFEHRLRSDYDPDQGVLVLRLMANAVHEFLQDRIMDEIKTQLRAHAARAGTGDGDGVFASLLSDIQSIGQAKVRLATARRYKAPAEARRRPDGQFRFRGTSAPLPHLPYHFKGSSTPQLLIEIGNSQKAEALEGLAQDYYEKSRGPGIKTVLTIATEYMRPERRKRARAQAGGQGPANASRAAAYCLYRGPHRIHHNVLFRSDDGQQVNGGPLRLLAADFIPDQVLDQLPPTLRDRVGATAVELSHDFLYRSLVDADYAQLVEDQEEEPTPEPEQPQVVELRVT